MINKKFIRLFLKCVSALILVGVIGVLWVMFGLYRFLAENDKIKAEVLVVEGWLPEYALEQACKEFKNGSYKYILTTGGRVDKIFRMHSNGTLNFQLPDSVTARPPASSIVIEAQGVPLDGQYPHFSLWVNDTICVGEAYTWWYDKKFTFPLASETPPIRKVHITYDNDDSKKGIDRDLYFKSVTVNGHKATYLNGEAIYEFYSPYSHQKEIYAEKTWAEQAAFTLQSMGLTNTEVIALPSPAVRRHRTYTSAMALRDWLEENHVKSINVFSLGAHARRSRLSYEKVLDQDNISIGVIAVDNENQDPDTWWKRKGSFKAVMIEALKYTYIQFLFDLTEDIDSQA